MTSRRSNQGGPGRFDWLAGLILDANAILGAALLVHKEEGTIYLVDRNNLGNIAPIRPRATDSDPRLFRSSSWQRPACLSSPRYWKAACIALL